MWNAYSQSLACRPLTTKATAAATIFFTSDSAAQYLTREEDSEFSYNISRALSGSFFGVVATGYMHVWWNFLERALGARLPLQTHRLTNTIVKVFVDQAFGAPFYIYNYYLVTNFLQQMSHNTEPDIKTPQQVLQETHDKASEMLWPTMLKHWRLWPLVHSINFYFVPLHHRVLVQNLVLVFWSGYLSHLNHNCAKLLTPKEEIEETAKEMVRRRTASNDAKSNKVDASAGAKTK
jgi:protein Mpv17